MKTTAFSPPNNHFVKIVISCAAIPAAFAGPDSCTVVDTTLVCSGNQSQGISITTPPSQLDVRQLDLAIKPASGTPGIRMISNGVGNALINSGETGARVVIETTGGAAHGIEGIASGIPSTVAPDDAFLGIPQVGVDPDVAGGEVVINSFSNIVTDGAGAHAIRAHRQQQSRLSAGRAG